MTKDDPSTARMTLAHECCGGSQTPDTYRCKNFNCTACWACFIVRAFQQAEKRRDNQRKVHGRDPHHRSIDRVLQGVIVTPHRTSPKTREPNCGRDPTSISKKCAVTGKSSSGMPRLPGFSGLTTSARLVVAWCWPWRTPAICQDARGRHRLRKCIIWSAASKKPPVSTVVDPL